DGLSGIRIRMDSECRIFLCELAERYPHLFLIRLCLWLDGDSDDGLRKIHSLKKNLFVFVTNRVAGGYVAQAHSGCNVSGEYILDLLALVRMHFQQAADTFARLFC